MSDAIEQIATREDFSGVVRVDRPGHEPWVLARGLADRAHGLPVQEHTVFALASVTKGITALVILRLVESGALGLQTTARSLLGADLPLVADDVTIEQLLSHRSGIGDYLDEGGDAGIDDRYLGVATHQIGNVAAYLPLLDGAPMVEPPGTAFRYNNGAFVLLAVLAERASGDDYYALVDDLVLRPAGVTSGAFHRSDTTPGDVALQYLAADGLRTNVLHMPLRGAGDGGVHCTVGDLHLLWRSLAAGRVVRPSTWDDMRRARSEPGGDERFGYGLGLWLAANDVVFLEGYDAGISARTMFRPADGTIMSVVANTSEGAWPIARALLDDITTRAPLP
jgi:CubicO group peptidase (beta-lactamase class C family)